MPLLNQFQAFMGSILFGALILFSWSAFNRLFYRCRFLIIRLLFEIVFFLITVISYFAFLCNFTEGVLNIFYLLGLALGAFLYYRFYAVYFDNFFEKIAKHIEKNIIMPCKLKKKKFIAIIRHRKKRKEKTHEQEEIVKNEPTD